MKPAFAPVADSKATVVSGNSRFTVLCDRLIRMEYARDGQFEDRPSQAFWCRKLPVPVFRTKRTHHSLGIVTKYLRLTCRSSPEGFTKDSLQVQLLGSGKRWHFGDADPLNLGGTLRTLDCVNGPTAIPDGLISRSGWAVVDDSRSLVFNESGWIEPRSVSGHDPSRRDLYLFGYGTDYRACLRDFCALTGPIPLPPRFVFGNWWSRYWAYRDTDLLTLMDEFRTHDIPLAVCIIDMDWHTVENPHTNGWTGYTWEKKFFPKPKRFLNGLHKRNLKMALNLHPRDGVHPHEDAYPAMARHCGIDPGTKRPVEFDPVDPRFVEAYFRYLHHPHENKGVDFWWLDWQQGLHSRLDGLDPLWWLNHLHSCDMLRDKARRPLILSRWGGWGNHRYPIGFSGDTFVTWESLAFEPYFTATASNCAYGYWSHDIGGHLWGVEDDEMYARWIQFGVFSPVLRIHSTKCRFQDRRPWSRGPEAAQCIRSFMQLRHRLVPYIYSMAYQAHKTGVSLLRPLYYEYPGYEQSYSFGWEYFFGSQLLAAPVTSPADPDTRLARQVAWLPPGTWYDFFTGECIDGSRVVSRYCGLDTMPVFAQAGAIVPMDAAAQWGTVAAPGKIEVRVYAGADGSFELYEDDGESMAHAQGGGCITTIRQALSKSGILYEIEPPRGNTRILPRRRSWRLVFCGVSADARISSSSHVEIASRSYDAQREELCVELEPLDSTRKISLALRKGTRPVCVHRDRTLERIEAMLYAFRMPTASKDRISSLAGDLLRDPSRLLDAATLSTEPQMRALCEVIFQAGFEITDTLGPDKEQVIVWNNLSNENIRYTVHRPGHAPILSPVPPFAQISIAKDDRIAHVSGKLDGYLAFDYAGEFTVKRKWEV